MTRSWNYRCQKTSTGKWFRLEVDNNIKNVFFLTGSDKVLKFLQHILFLSFTDTTPVDGLIAQAIADKTFQAECGK